MLSSKYVLARKILHPAAADGTPNITLEFQPKPSPGMSPGMPSSMGGFPGMSVHVTDQAEADAYVPGDEYTLSIQ